MKTTAEIDSASPIRAAFEQPQWYLQRTAFNIALRSEIVLEFLNGVQCNSILDIGCGDGSLSLPLLNSDSHVTYLDQSATMLEIVRSRIPATVSSNTRIVNGGFMEADLEPASLDLIICVGVLAYIKIEDRPNFMAKIKGLLKPGGLLILECTDGPHFLSRIKRGYASLVGIVRPAKMHTIVGSSSSVLAICRDLGFVLHGSYRYSLPMPIISRFMSQKASYDAIRAIYKTAKDNRMAWLGNECMYYFELPK
jgi:ubiquinone/menaquinone biosynthesis C-methylase UbiE